MNLTSIKLLCFNEEGKAMTGFLNNVKIGYLNMQLIKCGGVIMAKVMGSPGRYIQGRNELKNLCGYAGNLGKKLFLIASPSGRKRVEKTIESGRGDMELVYESFQGQCSFDEIHRMEEKCRLSEAQAVVGIGGGKCHDTAKAVAYRLGLPVVIVPTVASTDAPCSSLSVIYEEDGTVVDCWYLSSNPDLVLVDTEIISKAPARLLAAGMGDALATYFEARACMQSNGQNSLGGKSPMAAMSLAKLCYDTLMKDGIKAMLAVKNGLVTEALENVIEANTYLSGVGFESGGLAAAHAVHNGLTVLKETHPMYHGEKVAFGTLVQLVLENASNDEIQNAAAFCIKVGLPVTLSELGIERERTERIWVAAEATMTNEVLGNMPFEVTVKDVYAAMLGADAVGRYCQSKDLNI